MFTINNAYSCRQEDILGSIEPGIYADMVVIDQDIRECRAESGKDIQVLKPFVSGKLVQ